MREPVRDIVVFVLKGWPRLSETFIAQEIRALELRGLDLVIVSLRRPTDPATHPVHREVRAPVRYLPEYLGDAPGRVWRAWRRARRLPGYGAARALWRRDLGRDRSRNRVRRFGQACVLAADLADDPALARVGRLHAHFLHTPASVARYAAAMTGLPWSCSAHARDIWTTPEAELRDKLADVDWLVTCTAFGRDHLAALAARPDRVGLVYHGLDLDRFPAPAGDRPARDGGDPADPLRLLVVARTVPKKGLDRLLRALARLDAGPAPLHWRLDHIGGGPEHAALRRQATALGLDGRIVWHGPRPQEAVLAALRAADLFVLPCRVAPDGDRDGLPNVLMEAQSQGLACLSTRLSAVPELIVDGETGLLVPADDDAALADGIRRLAADPAFRARLGAAGAARVRGKFGMTAGIDVLAARLGPDREAALCGSPSTRP